MTVRRTRLRGVVLGTLCAPALLSGHALAQGTVPPPAEDGIIDLTPLLGDGFDAAPAAPEVAVPPVAAPVLPDGNAALPAYRRGDPVGDAAIAAVPSGIAAPLLLYPATSDAGPGLQRLSGEYAAGALTVTVPPGAVPENLSITYRNSINILPEDSRLTATLDGVLLGDWPLTAPGDFQTVTLPGTALRTGPNRIQLQVRQSHRIFCGPEASFAIWTDIAPARSGIAIAADAPMPDANGFRLAAAAQLAAGRGLPLVSASAVPPELAAEIAGRLTGTGADRSAALVQRSAYAPAPTPAPGAAPGDLARITVLAAADVLPGLPLPAYVRAPDGAIVLVLSDDTPPEALDSALPPPQPVAAPPLVTPGPAVRLSDLSDADLSLRARYARAAVTFRLPDDWLLLSSQKARMTLLYRYAEGLPETALMLVKVNETTVRLLPLHGMGDTDLPPLDVSFPARLLQPGMNSVSYEAIIPGDPADMPCPRIDGDFVQIMGETTLTIPPSPRMQFPRLARGVQALTPAGVMTGDPVADDAGRDTRAIAAQQALAAGLPPLDVAATGPATLTVTSHDRLDPAVLTTLGLDRIALDRALAPRRTAQDDTGDVAPPAATTAQRLRGTATRAWDWLRTLAWPGDPALTDWLADRTGIALLVIPDPARPQDMLLVTGPAADPATLATAFADGRVSPAGPTGQAALLSDGGTWQNWRPAAVPPQMREPLGPRNARVVAGNYASWSPVLFTGILATLMAASVLLALYLIVKTRGARMR
ncbi:cellulose synthase subunit [Loktanella fryxellensis]|uniref:Cyclic di-GMP-binding protein n=1 Tax=Loktanella fryxellensis TaxID=245187 RepID=A0A1H8GM76_9RHOB|nr:cellulose biosynthesis cyclic di-GMP-binding regulatory protein BcsB [Loktanella fryxellensis]SEN45261.1 cellulose synthase subunit [Loktanella fryxellensis]